MRRIMSTCVNLNNCQVFAAPTYSLMHIGTISLVSQRKWSTFSKATKRKYM